MEVIVVILALLAYIFIETKYKIISYIFFGIVNFYWGVIKLVSEEYALSSMFFIYLVFCMYNLVKILNGRERRKEV